jgi:polyhydroxybutyrate depolymerase
MSLETSSLGRATKRSGVGDGDPVASPRAHRQHTIERAMSEKDRRRLPILASLSLGGALLGPLACGSQTTTPEGTGGAPSAGAGGPPTSGGTGGSAGSGVGGAGSSSVGGSSPGGSPNAGGSSGGNASGAMGEGGSSGSGGSASEPCPTSSSVQVGDTTLMLDVGGSMRSFLVHAPPAYDGTTRLPVVFDFHGLTGTSNQQKGLSGWDDVGDTEGFITVYPQGLENAWNAGLCCSDGSDDVAFVRAIIENLQAEACIDAKRVYASGCSNGGGMSYKLACDAAEVIAGIAPVDFDCVDGAGCGDCSPSRPVPVIQFRGTNDTLVDYEGSGAFVGAQANFATWGELNQCTGSPTTLPEQSACETYSTCGGGAATVLCTVQNGTHCGSYGSFMIPSLAWQILERHALP